MAGVSRYPHAQISREAIVLLLVIGHETEEQKFEKKIAFDNVPAFRSLNRTGHAILYEETSKESQLQCDQRIAWLRIALLAASSRIAAYL